MKNNKWIPKMSKSVVDIHHAHLAITLCHRPYKIKSEENNFEKKKIL